MRQTTKVSIMKEIDRILKQNGKITKNEMSDYDLLRNISGDVLIVVQEILERRN